MIPGIANRLAGALMTAMSSDMHRHEAVLQAQRAARVPVQRSVSPRRRKSRGGGAAEQFAQKMGARTQDELNERIQKQQNWWLGETEDALWEGL